MSLEIPKGVIYGLLGPNGAGKTNLLEALSFLAPGRGLRSARLSDVDRRLGPDGELGSEPRGAGWSVAADGAALEVGLEVALGVKAGPVDLSGSLSYSLCEDGGTTCRIIEQDFSGRLMKAAKDIPLQLVAGADGTGAGEGS